MKLGLGGRGSAEQAGRNSAATFGWLFAVLLVLPASAPAVFAQRKPPKDPKEQKSQPLVRLPDEEVIDHAISEMLAAWQLGDLPLLHKHYADDVMVVSGAWEPPLVGWANFSQAYERQHQRVQSPRLERTNTYIHVRGNYAWAVYQWEFSALVDGKATAARGQTTLILEKRQDRWLIVVNHTSVVPQTNTTVPATQPGTPKPSSPPAAAKPGI